MSSVVDICNLSLGNIGQDALITAVFPPDGTIEAEHCESFYPIARDKLLEMHDWRFATRRELLVEVVLTDAQKALYEGQWGFAYAMPNQVIIPRLVLPPRVTNESTQAVPFEVETLDDGSEIILTNMRKAVLKYTRRIEDTTKFTSMFVTALSWLLASYLAGPITKRREVRQDAYNNFLAEYSFATSGDAKARRKDIMRKHVAGWHRDRIGGLEGGVDDQSFIDRFGTP